ncbi:ZIP family metal transporter [Effusibacillus lacus]|uniref:ZIP family metal transporter n=1 Tax=Effusibacillus lacus TaxID=1348429 RepID=A0A292YS47_9BACL|nr:ZIP family metal transporter [Effusibacillus lacus]TCS76960.1 hypothetical protein EDD64_101184 [Effusibacillus lacus]GAX91290.1 ZIP family metal transporter [Effusibacillus lacus]
MQGVIIGSMLSALATGAGALPVLFFRDVTHRWRDILLALTAGIMVAASTFSLIPPALEVSNLVVVCFGVLLGTFVLMLLERAVPHIDLEHTRMNISMDTQSTLILAAITLHNLPEGLSVGVSYGSEQTGLGGLIALAIGFQNAPEGFLVALFAFSFIVGLLIMISLIEVFSLCSYNYLLGSTIMERKNLSGIEICR